MSEIEACRTCGIFFLVASNYLRHLFSPDPEMVQVRRELEAWTVKLNENDCFPRYICTVCLLEFRKIFKFQHACLETQDQLKQLYTIQQENMKQIQIKKEICDDVIVKQEPNYNADDNDEQNICAFVYIDDLSDSEFDNGSETPNIPQFKVPHIPLKEEIIEEARVPLEVFETSNDNLNVIEAMPLIPMIAKETETTENSHVDSILNANSNITTGVQCELCLHESVDQQEHRQHLLRIHETKPLECHICGKQFKSGTTQSRLKYHLKWHRINKHIKCPQCGFHCSSRDILNEHKRAVHTKRACDICGKRFLPKKLRTHMEEHQLEDSTTGRIECSYCLSVFATEIERDQHILMNHVEESVDENNIQVYDQNCIQLQETLQDTIMDSGSETESSSAATASTTMSFSPDNSSMNEMSQNYENNDFQQDNDDSYATTLENEMSTVNITPIVDEQMQFACAQCPLSFPKVEQLIAHAEIHQEKELFRCHVCGKKFDLKFSLNRHIKRHKNVTF